MCARRCTGSFFKDSIDVSVNEPPSSIKLIVKNASMPIQIAPAACYIPAFWDFSGILSFNDFVISNLYSFDFDRIY